MKQLCQLVADVLGVEAGSVRAETGPLGLPKWDSLNHMRLVAAVEETYHVELSPEEVVSITCVGHFATLLQEKGVALG
ncbi:MAG TPA: acyl carrier protein [Candidatus Binatia bacterium]|nr:acyl carrier protein [Candidatus Binatia bacterium]